MRASKENAQMALDTLLREGKSSRMAFVVSFLEAAKRKLPSEKAFEDDAKRRRNRKKVFRKKSW